MNTLRLAFCALCLWLFACETQRTSPDDARASAVEVSAESQPGLDAMLTSYEYPYPVSTYTFESQNHPVKMAYMDIKPKAPNGRIALLLHGKNFSGAYWADTIKALSQKGWRVIVPDQIGFGKSSKPQQYQYSFHQLAANTHGLLQSLNVERTHVIGHSMGGMLATRYALMYPTTVDKLALVNPIGLEDWKRQVPYQTVDTWYQGELTKTPEAIKAYMTKSYFDGTWKPEYDPLLAIQAGWAKGPDKKVTAWASALTYDMIFTQPVLYEFKDVRAPTLLMLGTRDRTALGKNLVEPAVRANMGRYDVLGKRVISMFPNGKLVEFDKIGHIPQFEAYDQYMAALASFLDS